jgi:serine/threonine-protein kinase
MGAGPSTTDFHGEDAEAPTTREETLGDASESPPDPFVGQVLGGRYRMIERLAEGGMGTVYRAEHVGLCKEVAIKLVSDEGGVRPEHALRFLREAMVTSRIDHPNVISATDYGTFEDGTAFLAMTLATGPTLSSVMQVERPMRWNRAALIGSQIADAIAAAQEQGVVHRDLKPENLVLQPMPDGNDVVKVLDFGIAKYARDSLAPPSALGAQQATRVGVVVGTPGYMAPEQAVGKRADHRADLYAMGVILWECVVGRKLWAQDDIQQLMAAQLSETPPSVRSAADDASIPDAFDALVAALLARRPELRPQSAIEVRDLLRALVRDAPIDAAPASPAPLPTLTMVTEPGAAAPTRVIPRNVEAAVLEDPGPGPVDSDSDAMRGVEDALVVTRRPLGLALGLVALLLGAIALGVALWPKVGAHSPTGRIAKQAAPRVSMPASAPSAAVSPATPEGPRASEALAAPPHPEPSPKAHESNDTRRARRAVPAEPSADELRASARTAFGKKDFQEAAQLYRRATEKAPAHAGGHAGLGASQLALGDPYLAVAAYRRAVELSPSSAGFHAALGRAYLAAGDRARATASYRQAFALDPSNQAARTALAHLAP